MQKSIGEKVFNAFNIIFMILISFVCIYPLWYVICIAFHDSSVSSYYDVYFWPKVFTLSNFKVVFENQTLFRGFGISIMRTVIGSLTSVGFCGVVAYALSKKYLMGRNFFLALITITMFFSGGLIPFYIILKDLGLVDSFWVYIIPTLLSAWTIILMKSFFQSLPISLEESAKIDGANDIRIFFSIVVPISVPVFATMILFAAVGNWNDWTMGEIYISNPNLLPVQTILMRMITQMSISTMILQNMNPEGLAKAPSIESVKMAAIVITTVPIIVVYPFLQKYFVHGIMLGSIKE
jgi:putative aldouronate transport system permease protein